jgi:hypothetical protein
MSDQHDSAAPRDFAEPIEPDGGFASSAPASSAPALPEPFDLATLASWLPRLGAVLWLERIPSTPTVARAVAHPRGVLLLDHPALSPLVGCASATAHTQVTSHGPREWLCLRAHDNTSLAKLFLLPDTDYLAWDEMIAALRLAPAIEAPMRWHAHVAFLRTAFARLGSAWRARLMTFEQRRLPWLQTIDARPPLRISLLGLELARAIAQSENAELSSPLHAA